MREAMRLLKSKDNQGSLWTIFHYYARRQNSPEGQNKLRKEIAKSYLHFISLQQQAEKQFNYLDAINLSSYMSSLGTAEDEGSVERSETISVLTGDNISVYGAEDSAPMLLSVEEKKKLKIIVEKILFASIPTSAGNGSTSMKLPSPIYNNATSDKYNLLSPVMVVQLIRDFNLLNMYSPALSKINSTVSGSINSSFTGAMGATDMTRIYNIITEIINSSTTDVTNSASSSDIGASVVSGSVASVSSRPQLMSLPVLTTYINFITFQKVCNC